MHHYMGELILYRKVWGYSCTLHYCFIIIPTTLLRFLYRDKNAPEIAAEYSNSTDY